MKTLIADLEKAERFSLAQAPWQWHGLARAIHAALGGEALVVGGVVRDALLGIAGADMDMATPLVPHEVMARVEAAGLKAHPTGIGHGTVTVAAGAETVEVTTFRRDVETDGRRAVVAFTASAREDAMRRDFTINAFYAGLDGTVYDFFGGRNDLADRRVRFIGAADERIAEDYLRILRFFRFSARFAALPPEPEALAACVKGRKGLASLSRERVRGEVFRILVADAAIPVLNIMFSHGFLQDIIPAVPRLGRLAQLRAREEALGEGADALRALAALWLHTPDHVARLRQAFVLSRAEDKALLALADREGYPHTALKPALYRFGRTAVRNQILSAVHLPLHEAAAALETAANWQVPVFPLAGADLAAHGLRPGPEMGKALKRLEALWVETGFHKSAKELLSHL